MLRWMKRLANKDFHRRSIPDGLIRGVTGKADAHRQNGSAGFQGQLGGPIEAAQKSAGVSVGGAFRENADGGAAAQHFGGSVEGGSAAFEQRPEDIHKCRPGGFANQQDGFTGAEDGREAGNQGKIPVGDKANEFSAALEGEEDGEQQGFEPGAVVHHDDERVVLGLQAFEAMDVDDIASQERVDGPEQKATEPAVQQGERLAPDIGQAGCVPGF